MEENKKEKKKVSLATIFVATMVGLVTVYVGLAVGIAIF